MNQIHERILNHQNIDISDAVSYINKVYEIAYPEKQLDDVFKVARKRDYERNQ